MDTYQRNMIIGVLDARTNLMRNQRASWTFRRLRFRERMRYKIKQLQ